MPLTKPTCLAPSGVLSRPTTSTGMSECSALTWFPVSSFQRSFRFLTLSFVIRVSCLFQPVRSLSPPSVSQS